MNAICPICQRPAERIQRNPYLHGDALTLTQRINPNWQPADGICTHCFVSLIDTVAEIEDARPPSAAGFREHHRYTLTKREHGQWHHCNADMQRWRQGQIVERVSDQAYKAGYDLWVLFDVYEVLVAQGVVDSCMGA